MKNDFYGRVSDKPKPKRHGAILIAVVIAAILGVIALYCLIMFLFPILKMNGYSLP